MRAIRPSLVVATIFAATLLASQGCGKASDPWGGTTKKRVLTSIVPLHCFTANIAEPDAEVRCLLSATGPHEFHPSASEAKLLSRADMFIINGLGLESFLDSLVKSAGNRNLKVIETGKSIANPIHADAQHHGDHVHPAGTDPHVWLGIEEAKAQVAAIRDALIEMDSAHKEGYQKRAADYLAKLDQLKDKGKELKGGGMVTFHDSFRYFGRSFGVEIVNTIRGMKGEDPSAAHFQELVQLLREKKVRVVTVEPQYSRERAEKLAKLLGGNAEIVELDPMETGPGSPGREYYVDKDFYLQRMEQNIENLKRALKP